MLITSLQRIDCGDGGFSLACYTALRSCSALSQPRPGKVQAWSCLRFHSGKLAASPGRTMNTKHVETPYLPWDKGIAFRLFGGC